MHLAQNERGVTLVELVAVIVVLGIFAAVAAPRLVDFDIFKAKGFTDQVTAALRYAQKAAVASGCAVEVTAAANNRLDFYRHHDSCTSGAFDLPLAGPGGSGALSVSAPAGTALSASPAIFLFDSLGRAVVPATGTPTDVTVHVGGRTLAVVGVTGYVDAP